VEDGQVGGKEPQVVRGVNGHDLRLEIVNTSRRARADSFMVAAVNWGVGLLLSLGNVILLVERRRSVLEHVDLSCSLGHFGVFTKRHR